MQRLQDLAARRPRDQIIERSKDVSQKSFLNLIFKHIEFTLKG